MTETNVISYFLIIIGGFGVVWSFRHFTGRKNDKITEFEYAGFSTVWGSLLFYVFIFLLNKIVSPVQADNIFKIITQYPFIATPSLFLIGTVIGLIGANLFLIKNTFKKDKII